jgi:hypothetical protein
MPMVGWSSLQEPRGPADIEITSAQRTVASLRLYLTRALAYGGPRALRPAIVKPGVTLACLFACLKGYSGDCWIPVSLPPPVHLEVSLTRVRRAKFPGATAARPK